jgi:calcineurin-like phosphoesterase family protein
MVSPSAPIGAMTFQELNQAWEASCRAYLQTEIAGENGAYRPVGSRSRKLLSALWRARKIDGRVPDVGELLRQGKEVRVFGDPHFGHANIINFCERPFEDADAMDRALWSSIAAGAERSDLCLCLGDWALAAPLDWHLKARNHFPEKCFTVVGNHDAKDGKPAEWAAAGALPALAFELPMELCVAWARERPGPQPEPDWGKLPATLRVGVSHWPIPPRLFPGAQWINLHGHTHAAPSRPLRVNASMEAIGYEPARIDQLIGWRELGELAIRQDGLGALSDDDAQPEPGL